ncbi:MAG: FRG domain-containing protein [Verrucomicrobiota bacterium]
MPRRSRWSQKSFEKGVQEIELFSWDYFGDYIYDRLLDFKTYVFRGHRRSDWKLESTLDRELRGTLPNLRQSRMQAHLETFKHAARGRRGQNPPRLDTENDWWALGQHYGLYTPLLDWTTSPYVAAFFAFEKTKHDDSHRRAIWCLAQKSIADRSTEIASQHSGNDRPPIVEFIRPFSDENSRLVNQGGLFTRSPLGVDLETWVKQQFPNETKSCLLIKITAPSHSRHKCLQELNRMNINYLTLFPDLYGASLHCNTAHKIQNY